MPLCLLTLPSPSLVVILDNYLTLPHLTHLPSNILLALIPFAPSQTAAIALVLGRFALSQMDVPTRQAYVVAVCRSRGAGRRSRLYEHRSLCRSPVRAPHRRADHHSLARRAVRNRRRVEQCLRPLPLCTLPARQAAQQRRLEPRSASHWRAQWRTVHGYRFVEPESTASTGARAPREGSVVPASSSARRPSNRVRSRV